MISISQTMLGLCHNYIRPNAFHSRINPFLPGVSVGSLRGVFEGPACSIAFSSPFWSSVEGKMFSNMLMHFALFTSASLSMTGHF